MFVDLSSNGKSEERKKKFWTDLGERSLVGKERKIFMMLFSLFVTTRNQPGLSLIFIVEQLRKAI